MKRKIAITGSTGDLCSIVAEELAKKGYSLVFVDRNRQKSEKNAERIRSVCPGAEIEFVSCDLGDDASVAAAADILIGSGIDTLILGAGVYNVPITKGEDGFNNIFRINFLSQYRLAVRLAERCPTLRRIVAIGSVAHNYGRFDAGDPDYSRRTKPSSIYGNSKRVIMAALYKKFKDDKKIKLSIAHPGVTLTNMTNHYPKSINWLVKIGIKLLFPSPKKAARSLVLAADEECGYMEWIGPRLFGVWGSPSKKRLKTIGENEAETIYEYAESICDNM